MKTECDLALKSLFKELLKHEAKFTSIGNTICDDISTLKASSYRDPWAWESTIRRLHMILTRPIVNFEVVPGNGANELLVDLLV